jgi:hypothetical protein
MGRKRDSAEHEAELRSLEASRIIDVNDERAMRFWSRRLGVSRQEIAEAVRQVGPNITAVALKLEAPTGNRVAPPQIAPR